MSAVKRRKRSSKSGPGKTGKHSHGRQSLSTSAQSDGPQQRTIRRGSGCWRELLAELDDFVQRIAEIFDSRQGNNDGIAATINLLDNPQKTATRILPEIERKVLPFDSDVMTLQLRVHT